jgi:nucleoside 2-deoxyribosyltransferase
MNIYFSCSITGGRNDQQIYQQIVDFMIARGHEIPTAHLSKTEVLEQERVISPLDVYQRDVNWVNQCDVLVAEVSTPSHGVGYEIALALQQGKPVLCCYQADRKVSKIITGNTNPTLTLAPYHDAQEILDELARYLAALEPMQ